MAAVSAVPSPTTVAKSPPPTTGVRGRMAVSNSIKGRIERPPRILLIGVEGVGKSTFASGAPNVIFLCAEQGTEHLDVQRLPQAYTLRDVHEAIESLTNDEHDRKYLAIDTLDWVEPLIHAEIASAAGVKTIEDIGGGWSKWEEPARLEWRKIWRAIEVMCNRRNMGLISLSHVLIRQTNNPDGLNYDRYEGALYQNKKGIGAYSIAKQFHDHILFACFRDYAVKGEDKRVRGVGDDARVLRTQRTATWDAKSRTASGAPLPAELPLEWEAFETALRTGSDPVKLEAECVGLLAILNNPETSAKVEPYIPTIRGDAGKLAHLANKLRTLVVEAGKAA